MRPYPEDTLWDGVEAWSELLAGVDAQQCVLTQMLSRGGVAMLGSVLLADNLSLRPDF